MYIPSIQVLACYVCHLILRIGGHYLVVTIYISLYIHNQHAPYLAVTWAVISWVFPLGIVDHFHVIWNGLLGQGALQSSQLVQWGTSGTSPKNCQWHKAYPIGSMYAIYGNIYHILPSI